MQRAVALSSRLAQRATSGDANPYKRFPEYPGHTRALTIPTSIGPAPVVVYSPEAGKQRPGVHVNFHGGGFVLPQHGFDDPFCRFLAAEAGVVVVDVDYAVAPQHPFPAPPRQCFEVVQWVAAHGAEQGWDAGKLSVGGQSAGGSLAAAVARQALELGGPTITLQVLHYAALDLVTPIRQKRSSIAHPMLRPWMGDVFDSAYVPDRAQRADRLVSPAHPGDTASLTGMAPAVVIAAEQDILHAEAKRYAERLERHGALIAFHDVPNADHAYDMRDQALARSVYALIAQHLKRAAAHDLLPIQSVTSA
jgi:acetyl esterase